MLPENDPDGFYETYFKGNAFGMTWEPWHWEYRLKKKKPADYQKLAKRWAPYRTVASWYLWRVPK